MKKLCKWTYIFANNDFFCDVYKEKAHWNYRIWGKKWLLEECRYFKKKADAEMMLKQALKHKDTHFYGRMNFNS